MKSSWVYPVVLIMSTSLFGCGQDATNTNAKVAGSSLNKAKQSLKAAGSALSAAKVIQELSVQGSKKAFDPSCSSNFTNNASNLADYIGCILQNNDGTPETVLGAMNLLTEIVTGIENNVALTYPTTAKVTDNIQFSVTTSDGTFTTRMAVKEKDGDGSPWTELLDVCLFSLKNASNVEQITTPPTLQDCETNGFSFTIQLRSTSDQLAFRYINRFMGDYEVVSYMIDTTDDEMRFESWSVGNKNHTRGYVTGNVSTSLLLDSVTGVRFASAAGPNSGNWKGVYGVYDGTNICMNYGTNGTGSGNYSVGTCSSHPTYSSNFHDYNGASTFETWANDASKGLLAFDNSTFAVSSFFVNN